MFEELTKHNGFQRQQLGPVQVFVRHTKSWSVNKYIGAVRSFWIEFGV